MPEKLSETQLIDALVGVFRTHGYEGASMARISQATGLQKSSLYHRFPDGKRQMADTVASTIADAVHTHLLAPLRGSGSPKARVRKVALGLAAFYEDGKAPCILDTLSIASDPSTDTAGQLRRSYDTLVKAFTDIAIEAGLKPRAAKQRAERAIVLIEGSLVVVRVTGKSTGFKSILDELPALLCDA